MLSPSEKDEISKELDRYERANALCIEALRVVQRHRGWVSNEAILDIAAFLKMSPADVDGVATFYNHIFRKPVGRHVVLLCDSVSCWVMGCDRLKARLCQRLGVRLGETTPSGAFTVLPVACLGRCEEAPALLVDGEPVAHHAVDEILNLLEREDERTRAS